MKFVFISNKQNAKASDDEEQQITKEKQQEGKVATDIYKAYFAAVKNFPFVFVVFFLLLATQVFHSGVSYFISIWYKFYYFLTQNNLEFNFRVNWEENHGENQNIEVDASSNIFDPLWWTTSKFIYFYAGGILALMLAMVLGAFSFYRMCLRASMNLHDKIFNGIIRSQMIFFYLNTTGRILNRFSKDIGVIDSQLPVVVVDCIKVELEILELQKKCFI